MRRPRGSITRCALVCALYLALIVTAVIAYKTVFIEVVVADPWFGVYSVVVCVFILSRFLFSLFYHPAPEPGAAAGADGRGRDAGLQRGGRGRELDPLAAGGRLSAREARDRGRQRRLHRRHAARDLRRWRDGNRARARDRLSARTAASAPRWRPASAPRRAAVVALRRLRQLARARRAAQDRARLRRPARRRDRRPRRGAERAREPDHAHAGGALLRRLPGLQGGRVDLRRGHVLLGLLLRLPARGDRAGARALGAPALPGAPGDLRRRPLADQLRAAQLEGPLRRAGALADDRAGALPPVPAPAAALEALLDARVADRRPLHLAQEPARQPVGLPRHRPAAGRADRRGARGRVAAARRRAPARRSST